MPRPLTGTMASMSTHRPASSSVSQHAEPAPEERLAEWALFALFAIPPRVIILGFWIFSDLLGDAYDSWVVPTIGFFVAPSTTLAYALMWTISDGVTGAQWLVVAAAALVDLALWGLIRRSLS